ncbi:preprotein translocase subunit SecE [uncultured Parolsenella sp.]|uniref:preprotein translocase subunit SecE n=1 Tax=uncultured Parolsenella sp. TaxID=2083008 RepID=UPI0027D9BF8D|nr:preprotein translocase subunit SecE [uncultured Parolsenella sp.]
MPNKDRQKRSVRKARAAERKELEARRAASASADVKKKGVLAAKDDTKKPAKAAAKKNSGPFKGIREWFAGVRGEMKRVTWPSKDELKNYSIAVVAMLIVFGVAVALVDTGVVSALVGFSGLRS